MWVFGEHAQVELPADLGVRAALPDGQGDLSCPLGEHGQPCPGAGTAPVGIGVGDPVHQPTGHRGGQDRLAVRDPLRALGHHFRRPTLEAALRHVLGHARPDRFKPRSWPGG